MGKGLIMRSGGGIDLSSVTAGANDVLAGKVIVDKDGNPITGNIPTCKNTIIRLNNATASNPRIRSKITLAGYYDTSTTVYLDYSTIASAINLKSNDIVRGSSVLGVAGTFDGINCTLYSTQYNVFFESGAQFKTEINLSGNYEYNYCICKIQDIEDNEYYTPHIALICAQLNKDGTGGYNIGDGYINTPDGISYFWLNAEPSLFNNTLYDISLVNDISTYIYCLDVYTLESSVYLPLNRTLTTP